MKYLQMPMAALCAASVFAAATPVRAYEPVTHQRMTALAVDIMRLVKYQDEHRSAERMSDAVKPGGATSLWEAPTGIDQTEWNSYLRAVAEGAGRLLRQPAGLRDFHECIGQGRDLYDLPSIVVNNDPDYSYQPFYQSAPSSEDCFIQNPRGALFARLNDQFPLGRMAGSAVGVHAAEPDSYTGDWAVFVSRPPPLDGVLHQGFVGKFTENILNQMIDNTVELALKSLIAPFACFARWVSKKPRCTAQDIRSMATRANVLPELRGMVLAPLGVFAFESEYTTGLGHLMNLSPRAQNKYDDIGGFDFHFSGWRGRTGMIDGAIMIAADLVSLNIEPRQSNGPRNYEVCDGSGLCSKNEVTDGHRASVYRTNARWRGETIGHTEFTPLDNFAYFGWMKALNPNFPDAGPGVEIRVQPAALARPLHAMGDIAAPHHLIAGLGWGHRPYEVMVDTAWQKLQTIDSEKSTDSAQYAVVRQILVEGLRWHRFIKAWRTDFNPAYDLDIPVRNMLTAMATRNYSYIVAGNEDTYGAPSTRISLSQLPSDAFPYKDVAHKSGGDGVRDVTKEWLRDNRAQIEHLINNSVAGSLAFLTAATESMPTASCGDGKKDGSEACDDGNTLPGDGCSATCAVESGFTCDSTKWPSLCSNSCGNGTVEGAEECDKLDLDEFDDCTTGCRAREERVPVTEEPLFSAPAPRCGDGSLDANEACDDGDAVGNDGCSAGCTVESGWQCSGQPSLCTTVCGDGIVAGAEECEPQPPSGDTICSSSCRVIILL